MNHLEVVVSESAAKRDMAVAKATNVLRPITYDLMAVWGDTEYTVFEIKTDEDPNRIRSIGSVDEVNDFSE